MNIFLSVAIAILVAFTCYKIAKNQSEKRKHFLATLKAGQVVNVRVKGVSKTAKIVILNDDGTVWTTLGTVEKKFILQRD